MGNEIRSERRSVWAERKASEWGWRMQFRFRFLRGESIHYYYYQLLWDCCHYIECHPCFCVPWARLCHVLRATNSFRLRMSARDSSKLPNSAMARLCFITQRTRSNSTKRNMLNFGACARVPEVHISVQYEFRFIHFPCVHIPYSRLRYKRHQRARHREKKTNVTAHKLLLRCRASERESGERKKRREGL